MSEQRERLDRIRALIAAEPERPRQSPDPGGKDDLNRLCRAASRALPGTSVGLSIMIGGGNYGSVAASDAATAQLEELQFTMGEGPCQDAVASGRPVVTADLDTVMSRWPAYAPAAYRHGVRAVFAFPLQIGAMRLGAMDIYSDTRGSLDVAQLQEAAAFADVALLTVLDSQIQALDGQPVAVIWDGLDQRSEVYQAQGMIVIQLGVDLTEAMVRLRAYAFAQDRPLIDVARAVLAHQLELDPWTDGSSGDRTDRTTDGTADARDDDA